VAYDDEHPGPLDEIWVLSQIAAGRPVEEAPIHPQGTCAYCDRLREMLGRSQGDLIADITPGYDE